MEKQAEVKYAVQIRLPDGYWLYVMHRNGMEIELHDHRETAEQIQRLWTKPGHEDAVRVVEVAE